MAVFLSWEYWSAGEAYRFFPMRDCVALLPFPFGITSRVPNI